MGRCAHPCPCLPLAHDAIVSVSNRKSSLSIHMSAYAVRTATFWIRLLLSVTMAGVADLSGLGETLFSDAEVKDRLMEEAASVGLVLPAEGDKVPTPSQETVIKNEVLLCPIITEMKRAFSLKIPKLEAISEQLGVAWTKYFKAKQKRRVRGRIPDLPVGFELPENVQAQCVVDAKYLKPLLSLAKKQFLSDRVARESQYQLNPVCGHLRPLGIFRKQASASINTNNKSEDEDFRRIVANFGQKAQWFW